MQPVGKKALISLSPRCNTKKKEKNYDAWLHFRNWEIAPPGVGRTFFLKKGGRIRALLFPRLSLNEEKKQNKTKSCIFGRARQYRRVSEFNLFFFRLPACMGNCGTFTFFVAFARVTIDAGSVLLCGQKKKTFTLLDVRRILHSEGNGGEGRRIGKYVPLCGMRR